MATDGLAGPPLGQRQVVRQRRRIYRSLAYRRWRVPRSSQQPGDRNAANPSCATRSPGVLQSDRSNQYDVIYRAVYAAISALGPDLFSPEVVVDLDGRNLGRGSAKYVKQELIRSGEW